MLLRNELFIFDLYITVIEIGKNQESPLNGTRSTYDRNLNIWAIVQKPNLHSCLYILLPNVLPFLILSWKPILPVSYFTSFNSHVCGAGGTQLSAPSSRMRFANRHTITWAGDCNQTKGNTFLPGYQLIMGVQ